MVHCTNRQNSQKTVKTAEITIGVPIVTCLHRVRRIHKAAQMPLPRETSITCAWAIATARRLWTGLTMCLHGRPCVWFPFAAACCYTLFYLLMALYKFLYCIVLYCTDDACSSSSLSTTVIKFSIFWTPLANFLLSRPNSVEYGKCKTTTLLPSAKCTRPLFQGRTGCGGRPSGWHDIVTCQRLVIIITP